MNYLAVIAIYKFEMARGRQRIMQNIIAPVLSTALYFVVFGAAIGSHISDVDGLSYAAFIVPGLTMLSLLTQSLGLAAFGIFFPRFSGTIYEVMSAPVSTFELVIGYVGAAATKSILVAVIIIVTARFFVDFKIEHPVWMVVFLVLTAVSFAMFGFILGILSKSFEQLQFVPLLLVTPMAFLGGTFYSIKMLPDFWQTVALVNPVVYLISGFRWSFY
ncbi:ABC transporter permease, partial [Roseibium sp. RKSG952]|uniref:ABC transporter permease n=1 Tax=Roseibium sp. RKSG952 TaxID=2529384 RepID=UPI0012BBCE1C